MSWLGKIMAFLVLITSVVWMAVTVNVYVTRTNWKVRADAYEKALKESEASRRAELADGRTRQADAAAQLEKARSELARREEALNDLSKRGAEANENYNKLLTASRDADTREKLLIAQQKATLGELDDTRKRNAGLEDTIVRLVLAKEAAERERLRAENERNLQESIARENAARVADLQAQLTEARATGGGDPRTAVLRSVNRPAAPLPENTRGTVLEDTSAQGFVRISLGIDAGLEPGSQLDVYRLGAKPQYLGTLVVTRSLYPKEAVAEFRPARAVPVARLRPDELPRKGDEVGIATTGTGARR